ncbi:molybdopterin molybdotransferase MoeA [Erythrobacter sp. YT30]|uniref:molybdopterin molybdotransferase MoeA n=1 Tax=Erythrobacter sp. YT30 TaxID=1735012 RepID=UPI00076BD038|nr:molybdopterin molybdotransferase MoeA [Erythrobacter sp. YT30]KWV93028.1 molybdopterin biosynthesis protein [Erythrobacter sp. YT30]
MLNLEEAQERLLTLVKPGPIEWLDTEAALGFYLAEDAKARRTQPPADLSAMDGYAICGEGPWQRVGESRAGEPFDGYLEHGQCTRISTGAHMPQGSDRVLIQENAAISGETIASAEGEELPPPDRHVRKRGFDFAEGDTVLSAGTRLGPAPLALAISAGHGTLPVHKAPNIAILDSGDELASDPAACGPDQIPASNGAMIEAMVRPLGCTPHRLGPVADDLEALAKALARANDVEILITTGGASVGDHDLVQQALRDWGAEIDFWKVAIKPGKPLMVATRDRDWGTQIILGLPGNPVSSFVTAFLFALPLIRAAMGDRDPLPKTESRIASATLPATGPRQEFLRGISSDNEVAPASSQDSSALLALAQANCLINRPSDSAEAAIGDVVPVYNLRNG